ADSGVTVATHEGGPKNGVLTAVEDFVAGQESLRLVVVPAFHGLGVIYATGAPWAAQVEDRIGTWDRNPLIARLEADRIEKIKTVADLLLKHRATWEEGIAHAGELEAGWKESADRVVALEKELADEGLKKGWQEAAYRADIAQRTL